MTPRIPRRSDDAGLLSGLDRRWLLRILWIGLGFFLLGYLVTSLLFVGGSRRAPVVTVPDLRALSTAAAEERLERVDLVLQVGDSLPNPEVAAGRVLSQSPLPGREVAPGSAVRVILSTGPQQRAIPVVGALTREQAVRLLTASGFQVDVVEVPDPRAAGRVVGVEPAAGTPVRLPARVRLRVSAGPPMVAVPELVGMSPEEAAAALQAVGLRLGEAEYVFAGIGAEEVVRSQAPLPGDSIRQGGAVRVWIASDRLPGIEIRDPVPER